MPTSIPNPDPFATVEATHASANQAIEWTIPDDVNRLTVLFVGNAGKFAESGTEGAALASNAFPVVADAPFTLKIGQLPRRVSGRTFYTSADAGPTVVRIIGEIE